MNTVLNVVSCIESTVNKLTVNHIIPKISQASSSGFCNGKLVGRSYCMFKESGLYGILPIFKYHLLDSTAFLRSSVKYESAVPTLTSPTHTKLKVWPHSCLCLLLPKVLYKLNILRNWNNVFFTCQKDRFVFPYKGLKGFAQLRAAQTIQYHETSNFKHCFLYVHVVDKNKCYEDR